MLFGKISDRFMDSSEYSEEYSFENYGSLRAYYEFAEDLLSLERMEVACEASALEEYADMGVTATMESFAPRLEIIRENFLKNWYEKAKKFVIKVWNRIKGWFSSIKRKLFGGSDADYKWYMDNAKDLDTTEGKTTTYPNYVTDAFVTKADAFKGIIEKLCTNEDNVRDEVSDETKTDVFLKSKFNVSGDGSLSELIKKELRGGEKAEEKSLQGSKAGDMFKNAYKIFGKELMILETKIGNVQKVTIKELEYGEKYNFEKEADGDAAKEAKEKAEKALSNFKTIIKATNSVLNTIISCYNEYKKTLVAIMKDSISKKGGSSSNSSKKKEEAENETETEKK